MSATPVITIDEWRARSKPAASSRKRRQSPPVPYEWQEQKLLHEWLGAKRIEHFMVPNGSHLSGGGRAAKHLMAQGMRKGAPDIVLVPVAPGDGWRHVVNEMKRRKGGVLSDDQIAFREIMQRNGWIWVTSLGFDHAVEQILELGY